VLAVALGATSLVLSGADTRGLWQRAFNVPAFAWQAYTAALLRSGDRREASLN
jgi:hypothetical protein